MSPLRGRRVVALSDDGIIDMERRIAQFEAAKKRPAPPESEHKDKVGSEMILALLARGQ